MTHSATTNEPQSTVWESLSSDNEMANNTVSTEQLATKITIAPIVASQIPASRRILQVFSATIFCLLSAGIVFGYAALKPVLIAEGVYRDWCTPTEIYEGASVCQQQEMKLNMVFTVAVVATNVCAIVVGVVLDRYGPKISGIIGSVLLALGCIGFGFSSKVTLIDPYPVSYLFLASAGPFIFVPSLQLANAFPRHSGLILALLAGAFGASPAVFLMYRLLYQSDLGPMTLQHWFIAYLVVPFGMFFVQLHIMPSQRYEIASDDKRNAVATPERHKSPTRGALDGKDCTGRRSTETPSSETELLLGESPQCSEVEEKNKGIYGAMYNKDIYVQFRSFWFWGIAALTITQTLKINYFVANVQAQYRFLLHSDNASVAINNFFDIALPAGGLLASPLIGTFLDNFSLLTTISVLVFCTTLMGLLGLVQNSIFAAYLNVIIFAIYRPFYYTVLSDYCAKVFGMATFGKVYGVISCLSGMFNFLQAIFDMITFQQSGGDPRPVNFLLLVLGLVVGLALVGYVKMKGNEAGRKRKTPSVDDNGRIGDSTRYRTV